MDPDRGAEPSSAREKPSSVHQEPSSVHKERSPLTWMPAGWQAPANVHAWVTSRRGGVSEPPFSSFNLATHVGDANDAVMANRRLLRDQLPGVKRLQWLDQVHGTEVLAVTPGQQPLQTQIADAAAVFAPGDGAVVLTADCLPVFLTDADGTMAAVAHAGWRGLHEGVLEATVETLSQHTLWQQGSQPVGAQHTSARRSRASLLAWLGPAIGPCHFEVGDDVRDAFLDEAQTARKSVQAAFTPHSERANKWMMDIYALARLRLQAVGVQDISGGGMCTVCDSHHCFSYRRDGVTGRLASLIYLES